MIFRLVLLILVVCPFIAVPLPAAKKRSESPVYKGAIVVDAATGQVIFEQGADDQGPPASVTKLMTFLIVQDRIQSGNISLQTPVTVTAEDSKIGGTQVWLKENEVFPIEELLYALMIQSANDAASALARTAAGSREAFVQMMNTRAQGLGMTHTTFRSPHGLPPSNRKLSESDLTTPRDLSILSRELLLKTNVLHYTSVKQRVFRPNTPHNVVMNNHNHLLGKVAGVDGLKTGFTNGAGYCLAATALRNGRRIIAVVMGSPDRMTRDLRVGELIERGFAGLAPLPPGTPPAATAGPESSSPISAASPARAVPAGVNAPTPPVADKSPTVIFPGPKRK